MTDRGRRGGSDGVDHSTVFREFEVDGWRVRPSLNRIEREGEERKLEAKSMQVLILLAERPGEVCSKRRIMRSVWGDAFVTDEVMTHAIWELRKAFEDDAKKPRVIETIPRRGYRLVAAVAEVAPPAPVVGPPGSPRPTSERDPLARYKLVEEVGSGAMGVVWRAEDTQLRREVAIKFLAPHWVGSDEAKRRFHREARAAAEIDHPHVATVFDFGESEDGRLFSVSAYYRGETLRDKLARGPLHPKRAVRYAIQLAEGLVAAHRHGVVHRDIKPDNILVTGEGDDVKLIDFGLARLADSSRMTAAGAFLGTPAYMSPEQVRGRATDARTDLWSVGVVLFEMLTGASPFARESREATMHAITSDPPAQLGSQGLTLDGGLEAALRRALEKAPERRYGDAKELLDDLVAWLRETEATAEVAVAGRGGSRMWRWWGIGLMVGLVVGLAVVGSWVFRPEPAGSVGSVLPARMQIAVLPFEGYGEDPPSAAFCNGFAEVLSTELSRLEGLRGHLFVVPFSVVRNEGVGSAASALELLGANLVVSGGLQRHGSSLRLTLNLIETTTRLQLDSRVLTVEAGEIVAMQDEAATVVADFLGVEPQPETFATARQTTERRAYELHIEGRGLLQRYDQVENIRRAVDRFERALEVDSTYGVAAAGLAEAHWRLYQQTADVGEADRALAAGERALQLEPDLAAVKVTIGLLQTGTGNPLRAIETLQEALAIDPRSDDAVRALAEAYEAAGRTREAEATYRRAIELRPSYWANHKKLGEFLIGQGRLEEALTEFERVVELTPNSYLAYNNLGGMLFFLDRREEARQLFERSLSVEPNPIAFSNLGTLDFYLERYADAARNYERAIELDPAPEYQVLVNLASALYWGGEHDRAREVYERAITAIEAQLTVNPASSVDLANLAQCLVMAGRHDEARQTLTRALSITPHETAVLAIVADAHELLGERERAFERLCEALANGHDLRDVEENPVLRGLRADPRYRRTVASCVPPAV